MGPGGSDPQMYYVSALPLVPLLGTAKPVKHPAVKKHSLVPSPLLGWH